MPHLPLASAGPLAVVICVLGLLGAVAWVVYRFGPTLARIAGWCSWWVGWACGSQGGYIYCLAFVLLGVLAWGSGTIWYARRRGRWPSAISARLFMQLLGERAELRRLEMPVVLVVPRWRR
jgi:hypothetical protein